MTYEGEHKKEVSILNEKIKKYNQEIKKLGESLKHLHVERNRAVDNFEESQHIVKSKEE